MITSIDFEGKFLILGADDPFFPVVKEMLEHRERKQQFMAGVREALFGEVEYPAPILFKIEQLYDSQFTRSQFGHSIQPSSQDGGIQEEQSQ